MARRTFKNYIETRKVTNDSIGAFVAAARQWPKIPRIDGFGSLQIHLLRIKAEPALMEAAEAVYREYAYQDDYLRDGLPYGLWTCADGREVLFNRRYKPIWSRMPGEKPVAANPEERVEWVKQDWFYSDSDDPHRYPTTTLTCVEVLKSWGVYDDGTSPLYLTLGYSGPYQP